MTPSVVFIAISMAALAVIAILVFFMRGKHVENRVTPLARLAFAFVLAGILFGKDRLVGYGLMGVGVILAVADILNRSRSKWRGLICCSVTVPSMPNHPARQDWNRSAQPATAPDAAIKLVSEADRACRRVLMRRLIPRAAVQLSRQ